MILLSPLYIHLCSMAGGGAWSCDEAGGSCDTAGSHNVCWSGGVADDYNNNINNNNITNIIKPHFNGFIWSLLITVTAINPSWGNVAIVTVMIITVNEMNDDYLLSVTDDWVNSWSVGCSITIEVALLVQANKISITTLYSTVCTIIILWVIVISWLARSIVALLWRCTSGGWGCDCSHSPLLITISVKWMA